MSETAESEKSLTSATELAEAFGLGGTLGEIKTVLGFVQKTVEKTDGTVSEMSADVSALKVEQGRQGEQLRTAFQRIAAVEKDVEILQTSAPDTPTRAEFVELKTEVASSRLSWPKVGTLLGGIATIIVLVTYWDGLTPAS
jgi:hypothetical protein